MRTIGFYSFKGGVGRSNLTLSFATRLASAGKHVGIMDLDLEAPGLSVIPPLQSAKKTYPDMGLIDFFSRATSALRGEEISKRIPNIEEIFYETELGLEGPGSVHLAPAFSAQGTEGVSSIYQLLSKDMPGNGKKIGTSLFTFIRKELTEHTFSVTKGFR